MTVLYLHLPCLCQAAELSYRWNREVVYWGIAGNAPIHVPNRFLPSLCTTNIASNSEYSNTKDMYAGIRFLREMNQVRPRVTNPFLRMVRRKRLSHQ